MNVGKTKYLCISLFIESNSTDKAVHFSKLARVSFELLDESEVYVGICLSIWCVASYFPSIATQ